MGREGKLQAWPEDRYKVVLIQLFGLKGLVVFSSSASLSLSLSLLLGNGRAILVSLLRGSHFSALEISDCFFFFHNDRKEMGGCD